MILGLDYIELKVEEGSSLVLFYNPETLRRTLADKCNSRWLARLGYLPEWTTGEMLEELKRRAATCLIPHEVGVFIGYPLKDVSDSCREFRRLRSTTRLTGACTGARKSRSGACRYTSERSRTRTRRFSARRAFRTSST